MEFKDQYKHPNWQKKRLEILERENFTCQDCGTKEETLHVHHGYYEKDTKVWDYDNPTLWCLCWVCHKEWELRKSRIYYCVAQMNLSKTHDARNKILHILMDQHDKKVINYE